MGHKYSRSKKATRKQQQIESDAAAESEEVEPASLQRLDEKVRLFLALYEHFGEFTNIYFCIFQYLSETYRFHVPEHNGGGYDDSIVTCGIVDFIGRNRRRHALYSNPSAIRVTRSTTSQGKDGRFFDRSDTGTMCTRSACISLTTPIPGCSGDDFSPSSSSSNTESTKTQWFSFDFGRFRVAPTGYALKHGYTKGKYVIRDWVLEGSSGDGCSEWTTLSAHVDDRSLEKDHVAVYRIKARTGADGVYLPRTYYRHFRVRMTGPNSDMSWTLCLRRFEVFGILRRRKEPTDVF